MSTPTNSAQFPSTGAKPVVVIVGVDGSARNHAAILWAHGEAGEIGGQLVLVGATHEYTPPTPRFSIDYADELLEDETRKVLEGVRTGLGVSEDVVPLLIGRGAARAVLVKAAQQADLLVLGKRGLGAVKRAFVGSNSIAVAGRSPIPVVIVPDAWEPSAMSNSKIVVGVDGSGRDEDVLKFAFERARRLHAPLLALRAWQLPAVFSWSADDVTSWNESAKSQLDGTVAPWMSKYPEVEVQTATPDVSPAMALLDAAAGADLIVLGRHTGPHHIGGFHLGSTTRAVLHHADCPVAIVPSSQPPPDFEDEATEVELTFGPLY